MIKFFRHIRKRLIGEKRFSKYLLYAIGEIILVVIGILIALQINNWNEHKKNAQQEQLILTQLLAEYESNLQQIESKISLRNDVVKSCITLLNYIHKRPQNITTDSVDYHLSRATMRPTFDPQLGVSNELINAGKLYLIDNTTLRNRISSYSSFLKELNEEELNIFRFTEEEFYAFLIDQYQIGGFTTQFLFDEELRARFTIGESLSDFSELKNLVPKANFENLLNHPNFEDHITRLLGMTPYTNEQSIGVRNKTQEIIDLITSETAENQ
ncbi:MAG: hypothetical protein CMC13_09020 [Flavobacteriaceae bacterium]|nr:hypothetical protein [Flavobacteriaceae bacterium]|tara:strand:- start:27246 stop:28055 length:810 start_codon:yes stop_codon:yes gene_type:complete